MTPAIDEPGGLEREIARQRESLRAFANVLAHDLKAPLRGIRHLCGFISEDIEQEQIDRAAIVAHCKGLRDAARRMGDLIDAVYRYTFVETAGKPLAPVDMRAALRDACSNLEQEIQERAASVTHDVLPTVLGDGAQLVQLLQNLIQNAVQFCDAEPPRIHLSAQQQEGGSWRFELRDNGIGIPEADWLRVFEPFQRVHSRPGYQGSGLGLATCKRIVARHGGAIECSSKPGGGSSFFFELQPVSEQAPG